MPDSVPDPVPFEPDVLLATLERHRVEYVVIGGFAADLRGSPYATTDIDITPARDRTNFGRLAAALSELEAKLRVPGIEEGIEFILDELSFDKGTTWTFVTPHGNIDVALLPDGTQGYGDLRRAATRERISPALAVPVASLADVIRSKEAANRDKDRLVLPTLRQMLERTREQGKGDSRE